MMRSVSINHMRETSHKVKSFYRGIYSDIGCPGVETMDLWDECQDCDFKTNVEVRQRRTPPTTVQKDWKIQFEIKDFDRSAKPAEVGFSWEALEKFVAEIQQDERNKVIEELLKHMRKVMFEWHGTGWAMVDDYKERFLNRKDTNE